MNNESKTSFFFQLKNSSSAGSLLFFTVPISTKSELLQRFVPSEFGLDPDKTRVSDLDNNFYSRKAEIRRLIEAEHIPYTYICCNFFMRYLLPSLVQPGLKSPPREKVTIYGDGTVKGRLDCITP